MAYLSIKRPRAGQPQYLTGVDGQGLGRGTQLLFNPAVGMRDIKTSRVWAVNGDAGIVASPWGGAINFDGVGDYLSYTGYPELAGNVGTFFMWLPRVGSSSSFGHVYFSESTGTHFYQVDNFSGVYVGGVSGTGSIAPWFGTTNRSIVFTSDGTAAGTRCYVNGVDGGITWSSAPNAWPSGSKALRFGNFSGGSSWDVDASAIITGWSARLWSAEDVKVFHESKGSALYKAPSRKIWAVPAASSSGAGSAAGLAAATGVGASIASSAGSSSGLAAGSGVGASIASSVGSSSGLAAASAIGASIASTAGSGSGIASASAVGSSSTGSSGSSSGISAASGVGASTAASAGSSSGIGSASGVGASVAASVGSSAGIASASAVGDASVPGSTVGSAYGVAGASGVGASVAAAVGSVSGISSASAVSDDGSLSQGGDDFPGIVIEKRRKKTLAEQPNLHLQSIIDKAARGVFGESEPRPILKLNKIKELPVKEPVSVPEATVPPEVVEAEAEKVAALLAQYQEQVRRREMEEDEELLILIMGAF